MKKLLVSFILVLLTHLCFAQKETAIYKKAVDNFQMNYNSDNIDAIFSSFSKGFQQKSPPEKTKEFLTGFKKQVGKFTKREFIKYEKNYAFYKATFERALVALNLSVDKSGKINDISINPYKEDSLQKL